MGMWGEGGQTPQMAKIWTPQEAKIEMLGGGDFLGLLFNKRPHIFLKFWPPTQIFEKTL